MLDLPPLRDALRFKPDVERVDAGEAGHGVPQPSPRVLDVFLDLPRATGLEPVAPQWHVPPRGRVAGHCLRVVCLEEANRKQPILLIRSYGTRARVKARFRRKLSFAAIVVNGRNVPSPAVYVNVAMRRARGHIRTCILTCERPLYRPSPTGVYVASQGLTVTGSSPKNPQNFLGAKLGATNFDL